MSEEVITTKRGKQYVQYQVRLPVEVKEQINIWIDRSGVYQAGFLRMALIIGAAQLAESLTTLEQVEIPIVD